MARSPWAYVTSSEDDYSATIITGGEGYLYFEHETTKEKLKLRYSFITVGTAKGAVINFAQSITDDPSGAFGNNVRTMFGHSFDRSQFPCTGTAVTGALTAGVFQPSFMSQSGGDLALMVFGIFPPFAIVPVWGRFNSILPSGGVSAGLYRFELA